jgi:hypothetical protein
MLIEGFCYVLKEAARSHILDTFTVEVVVAVHDLLYVVPPARFSVIAVSLLCLQVWLSLPRFTVTRFSSDGVVHVDSIP